MEYFGQLLLLGRHGYFGSLVRLAPLCWGGLTAIIVLDSSLMQRMSRHISKMHTLWVSLVIFNIAGSFVNKFGPRYPEHVLTNPAMAAFAYICIVGVTYPLLSAMTLVLTTTQQPGNSSFLAKALSNRAFVWLADITYDIYLLHALVIMAVFHVLPPPLWFKPEEPRWENFAAVDLPAVTKIDNAVAEAVCTCLAGGDGCKHGNHKHDHAYGPVDKRWNVTRFTAATNPRAMLEGLLLLGIRGTLPKLGISRPHCAERKSDAPLARPQGLPVLGQGQPPARAAIRCASGSGRGRPAQSRTAHVSSVQRDCNFTMIVQMGAASGHYDEVLLAEPAAPGPGAMAPANAALVALDSTDLESLRAGMQLLHHTAAAAADALSFVLLGRIG
ncbi:g5172 [Coccomyxa elongata]